MSSYPNKVPRNCGLPREVLKWIQSLDLTYSFKNTRRDFSNGFLVAEIFSWYYPKDIEMHSYDNGTSLRTKLGNWSQLERFFARKTIDIPKEMIDGTIHCKFGAAELLVQTIYSLLTNRVVRTLAESHEVDFTDRTYQIRLPMHARSTASHAIKNNLKITECMTEPNIITNKQKAHAIINRHLEHRNQDRMEDPKRFSIRPTIGEMAVRMMPFNTEPAEENNKANAEIGSLSMDSRPRKSLHQSVTAESEPFRTSSVQFREIQVQQMDKSSQMSVRPGTIHTVQTPVWSH